MAASPLEMRVATCSRRLEIALLLTQHFPLGRFHATRWHQNPFEDPYGEWPPSPWRLLRALAARWYQYARETGDGDVPRRDALLRALAGALPVFVLPPLTGRGPALKQYHPVGIAWTDASKRVAAYRAPQRTLIEDHYRVLPPEAPIVWVWEDLTLTAEQAALLDHLLVRLHYFGRAESYCRMRRIAHLSPGVSPNVRLAATDAGGMTPVLAPVPHTPLDLEALFAATDHPRLKGWPTPPGTAWYYASVPERPRLTRPPQPAPCEPDAPTYLQFAVGGRVYPPLPQWIRVTERFRGRVLGQLSVQLTGHPPARYPLLTPTQRETLTLMAGKDGAGQPLHGHRHAFFLLWPDDDGWPTRLVVWRRQPFTPAEIQALLTAAEHPISWERSAPDWAIRLVPLPMATPPPHGLCTPAASWQSATPFVPPADRHRFRKNGRPRPRETPEALVARLLQTDGRPPPHTVLPLEGQDACPWVGVHETRQRRQRRLETHTPWVRPGYWLRVEWTEPIEGPLILGESSHFGWGLFVPADP